MHRTRVWGMVIDCDDIDAGVRFWSGALGIAARPNDDPNDPYVALAEPVGGLRLLLQRVPEPKASKSRLHLDIETDDVEAETRRLEGLGARRQALVEKWWIMEDPCGNEFCVVPIQSDDFPTATRTWEP